MSKNKYIYLVIDDRKSPAVARTNQRIAANLLVDRGFKEVNRDEYRRVQRLVRAKYG